MTSPVRPLRSRLLLPETLPFSDPKERRFFWNYRGAGCAPIVSDSFTRADSATSLGTADTGQTWSAITGTWGIASNQAYNPGADTNAMALVDAGVSDCTVRLKMAARGSSSGMFLRATDASNWIAFVNGSSTVMSLIKSVAGTVSTVVNITTTVALTNDVYQAVLKGTTITLFLNGAQIGTPQTVTEHATATKFGIGLANHASATNIRWDDFRVTA